MTAGDEGGAGVPRVSGPPRGRRFYALRSPQHLRHLLRLADHLSALPLPHPLRRPCHPLASYPSNLTIPGRGLRKEKFWDDANILNGLELYLVASCCAY